MCRCKLQIVAEIKGMIVGTTVAIGVLYKDMMLHGRMQQGKVNRAGQGSHRTAWYNAARGDKRYRQGNSATRVVSLHLEG